MLRRQDSELVKNIYIATKENPLKNDWIHLVNNDKLDIDLNLSDEAISKLSKYQFKRIVKLKIRKFTLNQLINIKEGHSKIKHIKYQDLKAPQSYLTNPLFSTKPSSLIFTSGAKE